ncbi:MAG TPA: hypothetical protein VNW30_05235 [Opitutaceae bacterium]|jgi:hypothetical protein|nr:hypothetical protein [Opitutaceae bacterium]
MIKVIDFNAIGGNSRQLDAFFANQSNVAIVTDMMAFECLKRDGVDNYRKSFAAFEPYAHRVVALKDFSDLRHLRPKKAGFYDAIVDQERTSNFPRYCHQMLHVSDARIIATIQLQQTRVQTFMSKIEKVTSEEFRRSIAELEQSVPADQRPNWRAGKPVTEQELKIAKGMVAGITTAHFNATFPNESLPNGDDAMYWLPFRYTVALQALTLKWLRDGGHQSVRPEKMRNDSIDIIYVAYGTLFDGVLSEDAKLQELSELANMILMHGYGV